jgi:hypothetical protein
MCQSNLPCHPHSTLLRLFPLAGWKSCDVLKNVKENIYIGRNAIQLMNKVDQKWKTTLLKISDADLQAQDLTDFSDSKMFCHR